MTAWSELEIYADISRRLRYLGTVMTMKKESDVVLPLMHQARRLLEKAIGAPLQATGDIETSAPARHPSLTASPDPMVETIAGWRGG